MAANDLIKVWVLVSFYDENGLHKAGSVAYVKDEEFNPNYMKKIEGGGGGSTVEVTQVQTTGTKIATITVDSDATDLYAPESSGGSVIDNIQLSDDDQVDSMDIDGNSYYFSTVGRVGVNSEGKVTSVVLNDSEQEFTSIDNVQVDSEYCTKSFDLNGDTVSFVSIENIEEDYENKVKQFDLNGATKEFTSIENISTQGPNGEVDAMYINGAGYNFATGGSVIENINTQGPNGEVSQMDIDSQTYTFYTGNGIDELVDLDDVNISSPSDGQVLKYDGTSHKWVNGSAGGGGGSSLVVNLAATTGTTIDLAMMSAKSSASVNADKTYAEMKAADDIVFKIVDTNQTGGQKWTLKPTGMHTLNVSADQGLFFTFTVLAPGGTSLKIFRLEVGPWGNYFTLACIA